MKKILLALLAGAVGATIMSVSAMAEDFNIGSAQELTDYAALVNGGADTSDDVVTLTADIDLEDVEWTPIGTGVRKNASYSGYAFKGTFNGNGKTISNLTIEDTQSGDAVCGFFGTVSGGTVKNLKFVNASVTSNATNTAIAVGLACDGATISDITVGSKKDSSVVNCPDGAAGVLGRLVGSGTIIDCTNYADVISTSTGGGVGGVIGKAYRPDSADSMEVVNCVNYGDVECGYAAGGIVGLSATNVIDCENYGTVTAVAEAGGIVGEQNNPTTAALYITGNKNNGEVTVTNPEKFGAGGIIGQAKTQATNPAVILYISDNENSGDILVEGTATGANATDAGGIVGYLYMTDAIVGGNANYAESIVAAGYAGGIVGLVYQHTDGNTTGDDVTITNNINSTEGVSAVGSSNSSNHEITNNDAAAWSAVVISADGTATKYGTFALAVQKAEDNDTIELLRDIVVDETVVITEDITINGDGYTVKGADLRNVEQALEKAVTPIEVNGATVVFNDIIIRGGEIDTATDLMNAGSYGYAGSAVKVNNGTVKIYDSELYGGDSDAQWTFTIGSAIDATGDSVIYANNSTISAGTPKNAGTFYLPAIIADDETDISLYDVTLSSPKGKSSCGGVDGIISSGLDDQGNEKYYTSPVTLGGTITIPADSLSLNTLDFIFDGPVKFVGRIAPGYIADELAVKFVPVEQEAAEDEQSDLYNIVLASTQKIKKYEQDENGDYVEVEADEFRFINRLNSADLTFVLDADSKMSYEIIASNADIKINPVNNSDNRYEFHFDGKNDGVLDTAAEIILGQVKISGYGTYDFGVDATAVDEAGDSTNVAHATTTSDNIVDTFIPGGNVASGEGNLVIDNDIEGAYIAVPTRDLTINVDFPNAVVDRVIAYNDMTVTVSGGDLAADVVIKLGNDAVKTNIGGNDNKKVATYEAKFDDGAYVVTVKNILTVNNSYNVTVEGAGYRTARYTVTMTENKTLNFWNNVKDNAVNVEEKKDSSAKNVTFLAGDIVKDAIINIYDLSAVVSYFGEIDLDENNNKTYAKYDLNRDGKIDSKDVAYVLVSWGK